MSCHLLLHSLYLIYMPCYFGVYIFWLFNKKVSYLPHSPDNTTQDTVDYIVQRAARKNSSGFPGLRAWPQVEREPRRDLMADLRREKPKRHLNQHRVDEYG